MGAEISFLVDKACSFRDCDPDVFQIGQHAHVHMPAMQAVTTWKLFTPEQSQPFLPGSDGPSGWDAAYRMKLSHAGE